MNRRGVASVMVIVLIGLTASLLTAVAGRAVVEQRRGAAANDEAQASRLLHAAARIAEAQLADATPQSGPVPTPIGKITLTWSDASAGPTCEAEVEAGRVRRGVSFLFTDGRLNRVE